MHKEEVTFIKLVMINVHIRHARRKRNGCETKMTTTLTTTATQQLYIALCVCDLCIAYMQTSCVCLNEKFSLSKYIMFELLIRSCKMFI